VVILVTFSGLGVIIETDPVPGDRLPGFAVQMRCPSKAMPSGKLPRPLVTSVTAPAVWVGSI